jgi:hypothetical protein
MGTSDDILSLNMFLKQLKISSKTQHKISSKTIINWKKNQKIKNVERMEEKHTDIILISDTRIAKEIKPIVKAEWGGRVNFSSFPSPARGVAIFFNKELAIEIIEDSIYNDKSGNCNSLNMKYENFVINLSCVYGPNEENPLFFKNVILKEIELRQETSDFSILGGDLNLFMSQEMDTFGYTQENNVNTRTTLLGREGRDFPSRLGFETKDTETLGLVSVSNHYD